MGQLFLLSVCLVSLRSANAADVANSSICQARAVASYERGAYPFATPLYGSRYDYRSISAVVTLADCSVWSAQLRYFYAVKTNTTGIKVLNFNYTANGSVAPLEAQRQEIEQQANVGTWMTDTIVLPYYDRFLGPTATFLCKRMNGSRLVKPMKTRVDVIRIDMTTLAAVPSSTACWTIAYRVPYILVLRHHWAFYGYAPFGAPHHIDERFEAMFGTEALDRAQSGSVLLSAYCMPLSILMLRFALLIVKKALDASDSHVYIYHKSLTIADVVIAVLVFAKETLLIAYVAVPFCLAWPQAFTVAMESRFWLYHTEQNVSDIAVIPITSIVLFTYTIQALLAADRFMALLTPFTYLRFADIATTRRLVLGAVATNLVVLLAELSTNVGIQCMLATPDAETCANDVMGSRPFSYGQLPRSVLIVASCVTQTVCCSAVFVKMLLRLRNPQHGGAGAASRKMVAFYLLLGTCCVGILGLAFEITVLYCEYAFSVTMLIPQEALTLLIGIQRRFRTSVVSGVSSWSVLLHLLVSSHCRAAAKQALSDGVNRLAKPFRGAQKILARRFKVQPRLEAASNGGMVGSASVVSVSHS